MGDNVNLDNSIFHNDKELNFGNLIEILHEGIWVIDKEANTTYVNKQMAEILGYKKEEMIGRHLFSFMDEKGIELCKADIERRRQGISEEHEFEFLKKDGTRIITELETTPLTDKDGNYLGAIAGVNDITPKKIALRKMEALSKYSEENPYPVLRIDKENKIIYFNQAGKVLLQKWDASESLKLPENLSKKIKDIFITKKNIMEEAEVDGKIYLLTFVPIMDFDYINIYGMDITEQKRNEKKIAQADKMESLSILISGIVHEINNPNNYILLNANILTTITDEIINKLGGFIDDKENYEICRIKFPELISNINEILSGIIIGSGRINNIVKSLKEFVSPATDNWDDEVNINDVIKSSLLMLGNLLKKSTDNFEIDLDESIPEFKANSQKLQEVIINLVLNSCQALRSKKDFIKIKTIYNSENKNLEIYITDGGVGIKSENIDKVLSPFFTTKLSTKQAGLGLSVSYDIIKKINGELIITSIENKGTELKIIIPVL